MLQWWSGVLQRHGSNTDPTCSCACCRSRRSSCSTRGRAARNCCRMPPGHDRSPGVRGPPAVGVGSISSRACRRHPARHARRIVSAACTAQQRADNQH